MDFPLPLHLTQLYYLRHPGVLPDEVFTFIIMFLPGHVENQLFLIGVGIFVKMLVVNLIVLDFDLFRFAGKLGKVIFSASGETHAPEHRQVINLSMLRSLVHDAHNREHGNWHEHES